LERLRRLNWFERIKTGPSPDDDALLQLARELAQVFDVRFSYKQIFWGNLQGPRFGWMFSKPVFLSSTLTFRGFMPEAELMLPEFLKGKLSLDSWRFLIGLHMVRFRANYTSGKPTKIFGGAALFIIGTFIPAVIIQHMVSGLASTALFLAIWLPGIVLSFLYSRSRFRRWELELDREAANKLGREGTIRVLEQMKLLDPQVTLRTLDARFFAFWTPNIDDRINALNSPWPTSVPKRSWPRIRLRTRAILVGVGFAIYWTSGFAAGLVYSQGRTSFACTSNGCAAFVVSAAVGYFLAILAGISLVIGILQHARRASRNKGYAVTQRESL
jgi:hypothetical protein